MDGPPEILSSGPQRQSRWRRYWDGASRGRRALVAAAAALAVCLGALGYTAAVAAHRGRAISALRAQLRQARRPGTSAAAATVPGYASAAVRSFPDSAGGTFTFVAVSIAPRPGAGPLTWFIVHGQHARPGQRYGLLQGFCGGQYVTPTPLASGIADGRGDLTIVAPNQQISLRDRTTWVAVYQYRTGLTLGGIRGPLAGRARGFLVNPPC
jgi:hypothetical protein